MVSATENIICLMGPTASGKTSLAIELAENLNGEVISVDSALIYKDMNIGTAKPTLEERRGVRHHLIDILSPELSYSVSDFLKDAGTCIADIHSRGKTAILAGGTMLYFKALIDGISEVPASDEQTREKVRSLIEEKGLAQVHEMLESVDPEAAQRLHPNDSQRVSRAMEVYLATGKSLSDWQKNKKTPLNYKFVQFSIMPNDRAVLHHLIEQRFDLMLEAGFVQEVEALREKYNLHLNLPSMRSVGYRQVFEHLNSKTSFDQMRELGIIATRQLAKRQVTWLRGWQGITPLLSGDNNNLSSVLTKVAT